MTNRRIVWEHANGSISVTIPVPQGRREGEAESDWIERVAAKAKPHGAKRLADCMVADLPNSRRFRGAWRWKGAALAVDMPLARQQRLVEIRAERDARLRAADGPTARAIEQSAPEKQAWIDYKQVLRDVPQTIDLSAIATPEDLEAFQPGWPAAAGA